MPPNPKHSRNAGSDDEPATSDAISNKKVPSLASYIPFYLKEHVRPYHGDFCFSPVFHPKLISHLMMEGFLPIACSEFLLPKLHYQRCVIQFPRQRGPQQHDCDSCPPSETNSTTLHIGKQVRKKSKRYSISINRSFDEVVVACQYQHGEHCWLYPPLVTAFRAIHKLSKSPSTITDDSAVGDGVSTTTIHDQRVPVRLFSIELWNAESGKLAAGELGYTVGKIYTSLTGFTNEDTAGSIQLATLGTLLHQNGFTTWDLGMEMAYKKALGSRLVPRDEFVRLVHESRLTDVRLELIGASISANNPERCCRQILDSALLLEPDPNSYGIDTGTTSATSSTIQIKHSSRPSKKSKNGSYHA
jgi:Leu/Phe-tRNA-protein transferase